MTQQTTVQQPAPTSPADLVDHVIGIDGPPEAFLQQLLAAQCRVGEAAHGAILRGGQSGLDVLAVHPAIPSGETAPLWLAQGVDFARKHLPEGKTRIMPLRAPDELYGVAARRHLILLPIRTSKSIRGAAVFVVHSGDADFVEQSRARLELTVGLLSLYEMRLTLQRRSADLDRLRQACRVQAELNQQRKYKGTAMAVCNEIATAWGADRVSFGLLKGRYVKLQAMSHTEKFSRKMELVQAIESAMEEALDQDAEVGYPAHEQARTINRAAGMLAQKHGPATVLALPMRYQGEAVGAITVEWPPDRPIDIDQISALRLTVDLLTARLVELERRDQWFGAKLARQTRETLGAVLGPQHTWAKLAAIAVIALACFLWFAEGIYRVEAPFVVEATKRQVLVAPFGGYLDKVYVKVGDTVEAGQTVLAELDTTDLMLERATTQAEMQGYRKQAQIHERLNQVADAQIAYAEADRLQARIDELTRQIDKARILSPISGQVIVGDMEKQIGVKLDKGGVLFEVAPIEEMRVELAVPEDRIVELREKLDARREAERTREALGQLTLEALGRAAQEAGHVVDTANADDEQALRERIIDLLAPLPPMPAGDLAAVSHPDQHLRFEVERIDPVAQVVEGRNVFNVRGRLIDHRSWLQPGMEGVARVEIDERSYAWIWTRDLVNWVRMKLWL